MPKAKHIDVDAVQIDRQERIQVDFQLALGRAVVGRVVANRGDPVSGAVIAYTIGDTKERGSRMAWSDGQGHFLIPFPEAGGLLDLSISHGEWGRKRLSVDVRGGSGAESVGDVDLTITVPLMGRVTYPGGEGAADLPIKIVHESIVRKERTFLRKSGGATVWRVRTGPGGEFSLQGMAPGAYRVFAAGKLRGNKSPIAGTIHTGAANMAHLVLTDLHRVIVRVLDRDGAEVPANCVQSRWEQVENGGRVGKLPATFDPVCDRLLPVGTEWRVTITGPSGAASVSVLATSSPPVSVHTVVLP